MDSEIENLKEQFRLTNMAIKELAKIVEGGEWQGATDRVVKIMLGEDEKENHQYLA